MSSLPPRHLCIAGALFIAAGVGAVIHIVASLIAGRIFFDFGFIGIGIGYGILIGRASSRKWALFLAIAGLVGTVLFGASTAYDHFTGSAPLPYPASTYMIVEMALISGSCLYVLTALWRSGHQEWFAAEKEERSAAQTLAWAVAAVAGVFLSSQSVTEWWRQERYEKAFPLCVRVVPYNAENGEGLTNLSIIHQGRRNMMNFEPKLPRVTYQSSFSSGGQQLEFYGVAAAPFEVKLGSAGFQDQTLTLTRESKREIRVPMQPLVPTQPKRDADGKPAAPVVKE
ncbi:MAG: hypothetical protein NTY98_05930 [Verrucomicrobia bacterium]|nr:hypothetical protein [Verrucomicrobiota bacterium]